MKKVITFLIILVMCFFISSCTTEEDTIKDISSQISNEIDYYFDHNIYDSFDFCGFYDIENNFDFDFNTISYFDYDFIQENAPVLSWGNGNFFDDLSNWKLSNSELKSMFNDELTESVNFFNNCEILFSESYSDFNVIIDNYIKLYDDLISTDSLEESLCELTDDEETQNLIKDNLSDYKKLQILTLNYNSIETNLSTVKTNLEKLNFKYLNKELLSLNKNNLFKNSNSVSKIKKLLEKELSSVLKTLENYNNYFNAIQNSMEELNKNIDLVSSYTKNNLSTLKYYLNNNLTEKKEKKKNNKQFDFLCKLRDYKNKTKMSTTQLANMQNYYYLFSDEYGYIQATGKTKNKFISSQLEISDNNAQFISEFIISSVIVDKENADTDKDNILSTNEKNTAIDNINISTKNKSIIKTIYDLGTSQVDSDDDGLKDCSFDSASVSDRKRIILDYNNHKEKKQ